MINITFSIKKSWLDRLYRIINTFDREGVVFLLACIAAVSATTFSFLHDTIIAYGDAESHLNIAKRVVDSLTPGFAQLGGIWLPLPHLLLMPFVYFDFLWRSGLAGSIVSGIAFIVSAVYIFRLGRLIFRNDLAAFFASLVFIINPNILYLQTTPMTELTLIVFFILSAYYFLKFLDGKENLLDLVLAALFGFGAALSRYDGWFLVGIEAVILALAFLPFKYTPKSIRDLRAYWDTTRWYKLEGYLVIFCTLAFLGIVMWLGWDGLILGDPLYFTHSQFSASSQQHGWLARGQLPTYHNIVLALLYYTVTSMSNAGMLIFVMAVIGFIVFLFDTRQKNRLWIGLTLTSVFIFYVITLYAGQSVIFIPHLTPKNFDWTLFNVRYGVMMVPFTAIFIGYLFYHYRALGKLMIIGIIMLQFALYYIGYSRVLSYTDGTIGLSSARRPDAERWLKSNYDNGLVLEDDFSRQLSLVRSGLPMSSIIYIGNRPYWQESLKAPEKYVHWIIIQKDDTLWKIIYEPPAMQGRLFKFFEKVYTSPDILIFKRNDVPSDVQF